MSKKPVEHYINPSEFKRSIAEFYKTGECTEYLGNCLNQIAYNLSYSPCFILYTYKEDMIGDALVKMYSALSRKKYNVNSDTSPFSYFTTIAYHAFINRIKREKKHHQTITEYKEKVYLDTMQQEYNGKKVYIKPTVTDDDSGDNFFEE